MEQTVIAPNKIVQNETHAKTIYEQGYFVVDFLDEKQVEAIKEYYGKHHDFGKNDGGNFWTIYSQDENYKRETHNFIEAVIGETKNQYLSGYKTLINAFVIKLPGAKSSFNIHQDTTAMDETQYSPLSIWIPLDDVDEKNGCLYIVPHTQHYTSYYRAVTIPSPFTEIESILMPYGIPVKMKKGQALFFDNRALHFSPPNVTDTIRVAVVCGVMPTEATYINCYMDRNKQVEIYEQEDSFIFSNTQFLKNNDQRPLAGKLLKTFMLNQPTYSAVDWQEICKAKGLTPQNSWNKLPLANPVSEPKG